AYFARVRSVNASGVSAYTTGVSATLQADLTAPQTASSLSGTLGSAGWYVSPVTVSLSATDSGTGVAQTLYSLDGGTAQTYNSPVLVSGQGTHSFLFHSIDAAGNVEADKNASVPAVNLFSD